MNEPVKLPQPDPPGGWLKTFGKILLWLCALTVGFVVLVFGSCLLMMR
jgi:hypothetical protein